MVEADPVWSAYLGGVAAFAGTLFALVLAARQIRGRLMKNPHPIVSRAYLVDSIAVTVELGAAAALSLLYVISDSLLFSIAVVIVATFGVALSFASAGTYFVAIRQGQFRGTRGRGNVEAWLQAAGNVLPLTCYVVVAMYALRLLEFDGERDWGYVAAVSWLVLSGTFQSIWWYARIWETTSRPGSDSSSLVD